MEKKDWYKGIKNRKFNDLLYFYVMARDSWKEERGRDQQYDKYNEKEVSRAYKNMEDFIQQELDKAREEVLTELQEEFSEFGVPDDVRYTKPLFYINEIIEEKLSKLKQ